MFLQSVIRKVEPIQNTEVVDRPRFISYTFWDELSQSTHWVYWSATPDNKLCGRSSVAFRKDDRTTFAHQCIKTPASIKAHLFTSNYHWPTRRGLWVTPSWRSFFEPIATHRLISEGGGLGGRYVVIRRLKRKLLHFLVLIEMNHLWETQRAQQDSHKAGRSTRWSCGCFTILSKVQFALGRLIAFLLAQRWIQPPFLHTHFTSELQYSQHQKSICFSTSRNEMWNLTTNKEVDISLNLSRSTELYMSINNYFAKLIASILHKR